MGRVWAGNYQEVEFVQRRVSSRGPATRTISFNLGKVRLPSFDESEDAVRRKKLMSKLNELSKIPVL